MIIDFKESLIENGYSEKKATELVNDIMNFIEKHSVSCLEDAYHYFMASIISLQLDNARNAGGIK